MRFSTDDGGFGVILTPAGDPWDARFFRFQLIVDSTVIGDIEPCIIGSMIQKLQNVPLLEDPRLAQPGGDPAATLALLRTDTALHDQALLEGAESFDRWTVRGCRQGASVFVLGRANSETADKQSIRVSAVRLIDYEAIVAAAHHYWEGKRHPVGSS